MINIISAALAACLLLAAVVHSEEAAAVTGPTTSRQEFYAALDYAIPGLTRVAEAARRGDYDSAAAELLTYMRARSNVSYFISAASKPAAPNPKYDAARADDILKHLFHGMLVDWYPPYQMGEKIDWAANPYNDHEWHWGLNRHDQWVILGQAYWATLDEKYAAGFVSQLTDWITTRPVVTDGSHNTSASWRTIEAGIRISSSWPTAYQYFLNSSSFTPQANELFLRSMVDHADHLMAHPTGGNWLTMEMNGLLHVGVLLPEHKQAAEWRRFALDNLAKELRVQVYPDGLQFELTTGYHRVALGNFAGPLDLCELNRIKVPDSYRADMEKLYEALIYLTKPSGFLPALNDSDACIENLPDEGTWADARRDLKDGAARYGRKDMLFVATGGSEGETPSHTSHAFHYGGLYIMRQNWTPDSLYLIFDAGPTGAGHQHEDKLSFEAYAYGETLLFDPGRYSYSDRVFGPYMRSTLAHNTALVDGRGQNRGSKKETFVTSKPLDNAWMNEKGFDYVEGVYDDGYGAELDTSVTHRRSILYAKHDYWLVVDRFEGRGAHTIDTLFHFAPGKVKIDSASLGSVTENEGRPNVLISPSVRDGVSVSLVEGSESPVQGWISTRYNSKIAAPVADYCYKGPLPVEFAYVVYPSRRGSRAEASVQRIELTVNGSPAPPGASAYAVTHPGGADYIVLARGVAGVKRFGGLTTESDVTLVRTDRNGGTAGTRAQRR